MIFANREFLVFYQSLLEVEFRLRSHLFLSMSSCTHLLEAGGQKAFFHLQSILLFGKMLLCLILSFSVLCLCPLHVRLNCVRTTQSVWWLSFYWVENLAGSRLATVSLLFSASQKTFLKIPEVDEFYTLPLATATYRFTFNNFIPVFFEIILWYLPVIVAAKTFETFSLLCTSLCWILLSQFRM